MMAFFIQLTAVGLAKLAASIVPGGPAVTLTHMAVGDGGGNPIPTTPPPTALVREVYRTQINSLYISPDNTAMIAEMIIPSDIGGWAIREIGIFDATGALFAVGNFPETYKPVAAEGSTRDMVIRAAIKVSSAANVTLVIDTNIVLATRQWVLATITAAYLIPGGLTGQVLSKASNADGDVYWQSITEAFNVVVDAIKEMQTAAASQTTFDLTVCTTDGVAVYIEGAREFAFTTPTATRVVFDNAIAAGSRVWFIQNEVNEPLKLRRIVTGRAFYLGQL